MLGLNGGLIGGVRTTSALGSGVGLWTLNEQAALRRNRSWPLSGDPFYSYTSLLLPMNGSNGSTTFTDSSLNAIAVTANGNAQISTAQSKFGGASALFDGTGDYLSCTLSAFGGSDFTIESWVRFSSFTNYRMIYESRIADGDTSGFVFGANSSGQLFVYLGSFVLTTGTLSTNTWAHVALTRASGTWRIFIDGVLQTGSYSNAGSLTRTAVRVGMDWNTLYGMDGYFDDYRVTNGAARYTANFTPPAQANLTYGGYNDPYFVSTSLLLHMNGSNGSTTFTDSSLNALAVTASGEAQISATQSRFDSTSLALDGNNDFLTIATNTLFDFSGDFTIELFAYFNSLATGQTIIGRWGASQRCFLFGVDSSTSVSFVTGNNGSIDQIITRTSPVTLNTNTWYHFAATRSGSTVRIFVDGTQAGANATATGNCTGTQSVKIGVNGDGDVSDVNGYIDEVRITKGVARYTTNFTPPAAPFPDS